MAGWIFLGNVIVPTFWGVIGKDELKLLVGACVIMEKNPKNIQNITIHHWIQVNTKNKSFY